jgi:hypothetical protein
MWECGEMAMVYQKRLERKPYNLCELAQWRVREVVGG